MPLEDLLDWLKAEPFMPFRIGLSNGKFFDVFHPSRLWPGRQSTILSFPTPQDRYEYDYHATISLIHINHIEPLPEPARG